MTSPSQTVWLGYDSRQALSFAVARYSIERFNRHVPIRGLVLSELKKSGLYRRPVEYRDGKDGNEQMWDVISGAPMSTEFAISRFLVPHLAGHGWALFMDSDIVCTKNISVLFQMAEEKYAVMCVKHNHESKNTVKMDGQVQTQYERKNWSSVMLFNCEHPANKSLTLDVVNQSRGLHLHQMFWLNDEDIGALPGTWNWLNGYDDEVKDLPAIIHFTEGLPNMPGHQQQMFADEWWDLVPKAVGAI